MKLELKIYGSLCETDVFKINDIDADYNDFGEKYDEDIENAEDYCCGNMIFERKPLTKMKLKKYKITEKDYNKICDKLEEGLSFGCCGWCS